MQPVFLGVETTRRPNWETYLTKPKATRTTKPESQAKEIEEKTKEREALGHTWPFVATVTSATIIAGRDNFPAFVAKSETPGQASADVLRWLGMHLASNPHAYSPEKYGPTIFCFDARNVLRLLAIDAAKHHADSGTVLADTQNTSAAFWLRSSLDVHLPWVDPVDLLINTQMRGDIDVTGLYSFFGIDPLSVTKGQSDSHKRAELTQLLAIRAQLIR